MADIETGPSALQLLKWPLLSLVLGLVVSVLFVAGSFAYLRQERANEKISLRNLAEAQTRIGNANKEIQDLIASIDAYKRMRERGLFSEPSRLLWVERVASLKERHRLTALDYELGPRAAVLLPESASFPSIEILGSPVQMTIQTLHDGDLIGFLGELSTLSAGAFPMKRCAIRLLPTVQASALAARLETKCNFVWVTLVDKRQPPAKGAGIVPPQPNSSAEK